MRRPISRIWHCRARKWLQKKVLLRIGRETRYFAQQYEQFECEQLLGRFRMCGEGVRIVGPAVISTPEKVEVGDNVHIQESCFIRAEGGLKIGDNTHISRNLVLYTINHDYEGDCLPYDENLVQKPVEIGKNVWIGMNVCITPGTKIGDGAIVGMGTVVSGHVPSFAIIGAPKWRILKYRDKDHYHTLERNHQFGGVGGHPLKQRGNEARPVL